MHFDFLQILLFLKIGCHHLIKRFFKQQFFCCINSAIFQYLLYLFCSAVSMIELPLLINVGRWTKIIIQNKGRSCLVCLDVSSCQNILNIPFWADNCTVLWTLEKCIVKIAAGRSAAFGSIFDVPCFEYIAHIFGWGQITDSN